MPLVDLKSARADELRVGLAGVLGVAKLLARLTPTPKDDLAIALIERLLDGDLIDAVLDLLK